MIANHEIERALLAVVVQHADAVTLDRLDAPLFDAPHNRAIFEALQGLHLVDRPFDEPSLVAALEREGALQAAGGKAGVSALYYHDTALRTNVDRYYDDLRDALARRNLANTLVRMAKKVESNEPDTAGLFHEVETAVMSLTSALDASVDYIDAASMVTAALDLVDTARERGDGLVGLDTGVREVNDLIGGLEPGTLTILLGSPGIGKTALWLQIAMYVSARWPVAVVELEMTPGKMGLRALSAEARVSFRKLRRGRDLSERDYQRLSDTMGRVANRQLFIAPRTVRTWPDIKAFYRRLVRDHGVKALFLDNVKIVDVPSVRTDLERFQRVMRELKLLSGELDVPILAIHHMSRGERENAKPLLTSGYGSSSIEQDADNVLALWRPDEQIEDEVQLLPLKVRDDYAKVHTLIWQGDQQRYGSIEPDEAPVAALPFNA